MFKAPEQFRIKKKQFASNASFGCNGLFAIAGEEIVADEKGQPVKAPIMAICVMSDKSGWQHVSITIKSAALGDRIPTMAEVNMLRKLFWTGGGDDVFIYLPSDRYKEEQAPIVQLWAKAGAVMPVPPDDLMGNEKKSIIQKIDELL